MQCAKQFFQTCRAISPAIVGALALFACSHTPAASAYRVIVSEPSGAYVTIFGNPGEGNFECVTPCEIKLDQSRKVTVTREGYVSQTFYVEPGSGIIRVKLELTAASEDVDAVALPGLN